MATHINPWQIHEIEEVKRMASLNFTAAQIARNFPNRTRNAVIGLCHRNKIELNSNKFASPVDKKPKYAKPSKPSALNFKISPLTGSSRLIYGNPNEPVKKLPPTFVEEAQPLPNKLWGSVKFEDLAGGSIKQCRYIEGPTQGRETMYCGEPVLEGYSWCLTHKQIVYPSKK